MNARTGARAALALGLLASLAGNALAAEPTVLGRVVAAWAPLALAVVAWLVEHYKPAPGPWKIATWFGTAVVAAVAAWVSYWHLASLAASAGETNAAAYLLPLSVDGLILVATAYLRGPVPEPAPAPKRAPVATPERTASSPKITGSRPVAARPTAGPQQGDGAPAKRTGKTTPVDRDLVRRVAAEHPDWTQKEIAAEVGCDARTVRRHLTTTTAAGPTPVEETNGDDADQLFFDQLTGPASTNGARS